MKPRTNGVAVEERTRELFDAQSRQIGARTDRLFAWLMAAQWLVAVGVALFVSPEMWRGVPGVHPRGVALAAALGGLISSVIIGFVVLRPGAVVTRHVVGTGQLLFSGLFIHLARGRLDTHVLVFGSLALIAFYRDWKALVFPSIVIVGSALLRGRFSVDSGGIMDGNEGWRFLEYAFWVVYADTFLILTIRMSRKSMRELANRQADLEATNASVELLVEDRTRELEASREQYRSLVETTHAVACELDPTTFQILYVGPQAEKILGWTAEQCLGDGYAAAVHPDDLPRLMETCRNAVADASAHQTEYRLRTRQGNWLWVRTSMSLSKDRMGRTLIRSMNLDVTAEKQLEIELRQAQKLESVGRLAAGVAHEINTPIQFVSDSAHFVKDALTDLSELVVQYRAFRAKLEASGKIGMEDGAALARAESDADVDYLLENVPLALDRALEGLGRVTAIVHSMKEFAHPDGQDRTCVDLNRAIESTLTIAKNEYKYVADLETDYGVLPPVWCFPGEINQVVLNLVVNAAHAIADVVKDSGQKGRIVVRTHVDGQFAIIEIADTGTGIPESARGSIFDPFFTTKEVGKGTGQGLAIARSVIVDKHGGTLDFETEVGKGTRFIVRIPLDAPESARAA